MIMISIKLRTIIYKFYMDYSTHFNWLPTSLPTQSAEMFTTLFGEGRWEINRKL